MTRTVWKYRLPVDDEVAIKMPVGAEILKVDVQSEHPRYTNGSVLQLWALVDPDREQTERWFSVFGTGHVVPEHFTADDHIGSVIDGPFVWHVFSGRKSVW